VPIAPGTPALADPPLIDAGQAGGLADLFKVLGNDTRLRLLHAIHRGGEVRAGDLVTAVGMTQQAVSNQLQRLVDEKICATRREGTASTTGSSIRACPACSSSDCACLKPRRRPGDSSRSRSVSHEEPQPGTPQGRAGATRPPARRTRPMNLPARGG
jgi:DNA-binding transcriptional ArsR family regulator